MPSDHPEPDVLGAFGRGDLQPTWVPEPSLLQNTNPASAPSDPHFAPLFDPKIPHALVNHAQYRIIDQLGECGMAS